MMALTQIGFSVLYGVTFQVYASTINITSIIIAIGLAVLVVAGKSNYT